MGVMPPLPLAEQLRPKTLSDVVGQPHLTGPDGWMAKVIASKHPLSILLWGPPGSGKTTLGRLYARAFDTELLTFSAVFHGIADLKKALQERESTPLFRKRLIVFVDEIHRFNKAQQDAFLPFVEDGTITLIGATTENPSFSLNNALLSRLRVLTVHPLTDDDLLKLVERYEAQNKKLPLTEEGRKTLASWSTGDARYLFNMIERVRLAPDTPLLDGKDLAACIQRKAPLYDKKDDQHYNLISALHKAVRGSDPDAALYWLARMLHGGEDPLFLARRIIRMATEDIGLADPQALSVTIHAAKTFEQLGSPEGELALAEAVVYLALAPKSNAIYTAWKAAMQDVESGPPLPPPHIILNAPTRLMKEMGYGEGYIYDHDLKTGFSGQNYFPDGKDRVQFYHPVERGFERELQKRINYFAKLRFSCRSK